VTEYTRDSPAVARPYCPSCEPDADPSREILDVHWCVAHAPAWSGADDGLVTTSTMLSGSSEAGGEDNRRWCEILHRELPRAKAVERRPARSRRRSSP
jgi:hypothetical protein